LCDENLDDEKKVSRKKCEIFVLFFGAKIEPSCLRSRLKATMFSKKKKKVDISAPSNFQASIS
jgi:hypothetical protein